MSHRPIRSLRSKAASSDARTSRQTSVSHLAVRSDEYSRPSVSLEAVQHGGVFFGPKLPAPRSWPPAVLAASQYLLVFAGKPLVDEQFVSDYGISKEDTVHVSARLLGSYHPHLPSKSLDAVRAYGLNSEFCRRVNGWAEAELLPGAANQLRRWSRSRCHGLHDAIRYRSSSLGHLAGCAGQG